MPYHIRTIFSSAILLAMSAMLLAVIQGAVDAQVCRGRYCPPSSRWGFTDPDGLTIVSVGEVVTKVPAKTKPEKRQPEKKRQKEKPAKVPAEPLVLPLVDPPAPVDTGEVAADPEEPEQPAGPEEPRVIPADKASSLTISVEHADVDINVFIAGSELDLAGLIRSALREVK